MMIEVNVVVTFNYGLPESLPGSWSCSILGTGFVDVFTLLKYIKLCMYDLSVPCIYILFQ